MWIESPHIDADKADPQNNRQSGKLTKILATRLVLESGDCGGC